MKDYLVVANQTLGSPNLIEELRRRVDSGPCRFHVVVPATFNPDSWTHTLDQARTIAFERLHEALERFEELGVEVDGDVGDERPLDAIQDALRRWPCDEVILSTLPAGASRWLKMDLVSRASRSLPVPVTHVEAKQMP
jgi:nucleotide-binding universal stress UspA family protein